MRHSTDTDRVFPHAYTYADGLMHPGDRPGLGVDLDEDMASKEEKRKNMALLNTYSSEQDISEARGWQPGLGEIEV